MKRISVRRIIETLILTAFLLSVTSIASAQSNRQVAAEPFSGRVTLIDKRASSSVPFYLREINVETGPIIRQAWQRARPVVTQRIAEALHERDIGGGFRTSRNNLTFAENGDVFIGADSRGFTLKYVLRGNVLRTSLRVPGPSPQDPRFNINFDVELMVDVDKNGYDLTARPVRLKMNVGRPTGVNTTGDLTVHANNLIKFFSGNDFIGTALNAVNNSEFAIHIPINLEMSKLVKGKFLNSTTLSIGYDPSNPNRVTLTLADTVAATRPAAPPKPPFVITTPVIRPSLAHPSSFHVIWDGGPNYPGAKVWVSTNGGPEVQMFVGVQAHSEIFKYPKASIELMVPLELRGSVYKFSLKDGNRTLSTASAVVP